jgi:hypothetical protein
LLGSPASIQGGTGGPVDRYRLWRLHLPFGRVLGFVRRHPPAGSATNPGQAEMGVHVPDNEESSFSFPRIGGRISVRELEVAVVALPHGWTGVRADALDGWIVGRARTEVVPAGVREIDIRSSVPGRRSRSFQVTEPGKVAHIVGWIDSLGVVQGGAYHCPAVFRFPLVTLDFRSAGGRLLAEATALYAYGGGSGPCFPIRLSIRGRAQTPLVGDFLPRVAKLLHVRFSA